MPMLQAVAVTMLPPSSGRIYHHPATTALFAICTFEAGMSLRSILDPSTSPLLLLPPMPATLTVSCDSKGEKHHKVWKHGAAEGSAAQEENKQPGTLSKDPELKKVITLLSKLC
eukprot:TRINITY_DN108762_c0_g1_i1.p2 TRINITY_DN108762_c0_g1~~TRINITY_DN108762_c0_g1_i1.p2  ORF type:complete len:114 (+),score=24.68 TRINITY_DN108762_c0_g1_i1:105-446(+)